MGLEATWSLVDIPVDARDAAQAAARKEGLSVGEWLTRRILKRFSELNVREQEDAFVALRNHVAELADRLERFEDRSRAEPMRDALKKLHQGLTRLNDELIRMAGHSAIQVSQLSTSLEALGGRVEGLHEHDVESRGAFERRMAQLQEFVEGINLRHAAETRAIASRMDSIGGTLAESRGLIADERNAIERLEENLAKNDARYGGTFRAFDEKIASASEKIERVGTIASESTTALDQRIVSLQAEFGNVNARNAEERQLTAVRLEKLYGKVDDLQADVTGMCSALDRRVLLSQQALQSLDSRHAEMAHSLATSVESVAAQLETARSGSVQNTAKLETRIASIETSAKTAATAETATHNRFAAIEHQISDLANRTNTATTAVSALLPKTEAIETQLGQLNLRLQSEVENQQQAVEQLRGSILEQTLTALGDKLEAEGRKQQAAIADLKNGLLNQLSQAFDERAEAEEHKQQDAMAQLQSNFASALHGLGQTFESEARKQQEAIAELKASLAAPQTVPAVGQTQASDAVPVKTPDVALVETPIAEQLPVQAEALVVQTDAPPVHGEENAVGWATQQHEQPVLDLTTLADHSAAEVAFADEPAEAVPQPAAVELPHPFAAREQVEHPALEPLSLGAMEQLAPSAVMARDSAADEPMAPSYLSAARQSLQAAAVHNEGEGSGKELFGFRFLKSVPLIAKQKGQTTSYALIAGIALLAILAIIVGAAELISRSEPSTGMNSFGTSTASQTKVSRVTRHVGTKATSSLSAARGISRQDRTATLAKGGDAQAQLLIGLRDLSKSDVADAAPWLERAAIQGVPVAQYRLATLYASGRGVPADKVKAFRWYLAAAQSGNRKAMSNLAVAYAQGDGIQKNPQEAGRWFLKAAQLGLSDAQFDLAILYERGLGVPQNLTDAYRWYVIAAKAGDKESKDRVDALSSQLTTEDRAAAETAAAEFKPLPMNARANEPQ
jgi:localization factor PodJL